MSAASLNGHGVKSADGHYTLNLPSSDAGMKLVLMLKIQHDFFIFNLVFQINFQAGCT